jgi:exodeoxyribonuclease VII large subunit
MPVPPNIRPLTVSRLTTAVKLRLEEHFPEVWVSGEVSNLVRASSGHIYFSLKDAKASLKCVMLRAFAFRLHFDLRDGQEIIAKGGISLYEQRGDYQLYVQQLEPMGVGSAELALRQLKEKLLRKGYFDPNRKRPLPKYPRRIALIASPTGAAIRDMLEILAKRWPMTDVVVKPSLVQGPGAAESLTESVRILSELHVSRRVPLHAIVLGRGGGSSEDLAAFNTEILADAIFESAVPVIAAVGHETDVSIADLVADYRALTPSQAITALCPDRQELMDGLRELDSRLRDAVLHRLQLAKSNVDRLADRPVLRNPLKRIQDQEQRLDELSERMKKAVQRQIVKRGDKLSSLAERLESLSPLNVLKRGYSLTQRADSEQVIRSAADVQPGDELITRVAQGQIVSRVERVIQPEVPADSKLNSSE